MYLQIGSGYSKKELQDFNAKLVDHWQAFDKRNPPKCIELASGFKEKPDAWIEPSKSAIVQVRGKYDTYIFLVENMAYNFYHVIFLNVF